MALRAQDIEHLQRERLWWLGLIESVAKGTYNITRTENGARVDTATDDLDRFKNAVESIERVLAYEAIILDS